MHFNFLYRVLLIAFFVCGLNHSCTGKFVSSSASAAGERDQAAELALVDSGSAHIATGYYIDRRLKNFFQKAIGDNPRGVTATSNAFLFDNPEEVLTPAEIAEMGATDLLEKKRCISSNKGALWGKGVCKSTSLVRSLATFRTSEATQTYFSAIRNVAAPLCRTLVATELERPAEQNYLILRPVDVMLDSEALTATDVSEVMTKLYGYSPQPLDVHPGSEGVANFMLSEMRQHRDGADSVTETSATQFMRELYEGLCIVLTHSPQMMLH